MELTDVLFMIKYAFFMVMCMNMHAVAELVPVHQPWQKFIALLVCISPTIQHCQLSFMTGLIPNVFLCCRVEQDILLTSKIAFKTHKSCFQKMMLIYDAHIFPAVSLASCGTAGSK